MAIAGPGDDAVRTDKQGTETEVVTRPAGHVPEPGVAQRHVPQARINAEIKDDAAAVPHQVAEPGAVSQAEVRSIMTNQRLLVAEFVRDRGT